MPPVEFRLASALRLDWRGTASSAQLERSVVPTLRGEREDSMEYRVSHPFFERQQLAVRTAGLFKGAVLLLDGQPMKAKRGKYVIKNDVGDDTSVRIDAVFIDPIPVIKIGTEAVRLAPALSWYEYAWIGIPVLLVFVGGALGGGLGVAAGYSNSRIFRSDRGTGTKYLLTGITTVAALVAFLVLATVIQIAVRTARQ